MGVDGEERANGDQNGKRTSRKEAQIGQETGRGITGTEQV